MEHMTLAEYKEYLKSQKETKYHNKKTQVDGIIFDSESEANRYCELKLLIRSGQISDLKLQPKFLLQEAVRKNGTTHKSIHYKADFQYIENGQTVIEDVKGKITKEFAIKRKLFEKRYPDLEIRLIK